MTGQPPSVWKELSRLERDEFWEAGKKFKGIK